MIKSWSELSWAFNRCSNTGVAESTRRYASVTILRFHSYFSSVCIELSFWSLALTSSITIGSFLPVSRRVMALRNLIYYGCLTIGLHSESLFSGKALTIWSVYSDWLGFRELLSYSSDFSTIVFAGLGPTLRNLLELARSRLDLKFFVDFGSLSASASSYSINSSLIFGCSKDVDNISVCDLNNFRPLPFLFEVFLFLLNRCLNSSGTFALTWLMIVFSIACIKNDLFWESESEKTPLGVGLSFVI